MKDKTSEKSGNSTEQDKEDKPQRGSLKDKLPSEGAPYDGAPEQQDGAVRGT